MADETESAASAATESAATESPGGGIKSAAEVIEKVLAEGKGEEAKPEAKKDKPARRVEALEAKAKEREAAQAEAPDGAVERARYHLQHGDVAKALEVFGDLKSLGDGLPAAVREALGRSLGINSAQWEKFRKVEAASKRALAARETELRGIIGQLQQEYGPLHQARELYKAEDYDGAFRAAFGEDAADYQRKLIGQRVGKNPEVEKLRAELEAERQERREQERKAAEQRAAAEQQQAVHDYLNAIQSQLRESDDPHVRHYAQRPAFIQRIYQIQKASYNAETNVCVPLAHAAEQARDEIQNSINEWAFENAGVNPANAARASAPPAKPPVAKAPARTLKQSQAAEANGKSAKLSSEQIRDYHQRLMEQLPADS